MCWGTWLRNKCDYRKLLATFRSKISLFPLRFISGLIFAFLAHFWRFFPGTCICKWNAHLYISRLRWQLNWLFFSRFFSVGSFSLILVKLVIRRKQKITTYFSTKQKHLPILTFLFHLVFRGKFRFTLHTK